MAVAVVGTGQPAVEQPTHQPVPTARGFAEPKGSWFRLQQLARVGQSETLPGVGRVDVELGGGGSRVVGGGGGGELA